jgi:nucleoside-diphosphate-sugar epimerase
LLSCIEKARRILDYEPTTTFDDGLKNVHQWFSDNWIDIQKSAEF